MALFSVAEAVCSFPECGKAVRATGLCQAHYRQQRKGHELRPLRLYRRYDGPPLAVCSFDGCDGAVVSLGLCRVHYVQNYRDRPLTEKGPTPAKYEDGAICAHAGCAEPAAIRYLCKNHYRKIAYQEHKSHYLERATDRRWEARRIVDEDKLSRGCLICGYDARATALTHHHLDPTAKSFAIGQEMAKHSMEDTKTEMTKCVVLCRNCHAILHEDLGNVAQTEVELRGRYGTVI